jgi:DNA repair exonuclease SbcCD ATPase subunit
MYYCVNTLKAKGLMFTYKTGDIKMSTPISIRLSDEVREEFKNLSEQSGMKQEDFIASLIAAFKERQTETDTGSPVYRERQKVTQALAQVERVVIGFLEIAHNDKNIAVVAATEKIAAAQGEASELKDQLKNAKTEIQEVLQVKNEFEEKIKILEGQAGSLQALQDAWKEKESSLNARLADLDAEAKEARKLKTELAGAAAELMKCKNIVALAEQKAITDKKALDDMQARAEKLESILDKSRLDLQSAKDAANKELITLTQKHAEERGNLLDKSRIDTQDVKDAANKDLVVLTQKHAEERGKLKAQIDYQSQQIVQLQSDLAALKKSKSPAK